MSDVTRILSQIESGDPSAAEQLLPLVYDELRKLAAAKLADEAGGDALMAKHVLDALLATPTPAMAKALGEAVGPKAVRKPKGSKTPLLDESGVDLTAMAAEGKLSPPSGRRP